jgi:mRNA interferase HigB
MRIIKPSTLVQWAKRHSAAAPALLHWFEITRKATWKTLADVRRDFPHADLVRVESLKPVLVFNIAGNKFRLICAAHFNKGRVYLLDFLTHADYSKDAWKRRL